MLESGGAGGCFALKASRVSLSCLAMTSSLQVNLTAPLTTLMFSTRKGSRLGCTTWKLA